jgi:hypothetical protein
MTDANGTSIHGVDRRKTYVNKMQSHNFTIATSQGYYPDE